MRITNCERSFAVLSVIASVMLSKRYNEHCLYYVVNYDKVIANMTVGKDVSTLFTDVVNCIQTGKLRLNNVALSLYVLIR